MPHTHEGRLGNEAPYSHLFQLGSLITFSVVWVIDSLILRFSVFISKYIPFIVNVIIFGVILALAIVLIQISQKTLFNTPENKEELIKEGIFNRVRHPLYLGVLLIYFSLFFLSISLISLGVWVIIFLIYNRLAAYEEKELETIYKEDYRDYRKSVPRWIPRIRT
ncbi:MAG: methyltransferase family protein [Promethearchaeota archaeon]|jgi:protein-S-isoprenylcysteine O-methyltransferase Ste14